MSLVMEDIVYSRTFRGYISVTEKIITTRHLYCFAPSDAFNAKSTTDGAAAEGRSAAQIPRLKQATMVRWGGSRFSARFRVVRDDIFIDISLIAVVFARDSGIIPFLDH